MGEIKKTEQPSNAKRIIKWAFILSTIIFLATQMMFFNELKIRGLYSNAIVGVVFILVSVVYLATVGGIKRKLLWSLVLFPLILLNYLTILLGRKVYEKELTDGVLIEVTGGGIMSCGENVHLTRISYGILNKQIHSEGDVCLVGIEKIEVVKLDGHSAELLIYHDGRLNSESPYLYIIRNKNIW